jgi:uncharacterized protein (TIRG00374 family)
MTTPGKVRDPVTPTSRPSRLVRVRGWWRRLPLPVRATSRVLLVALVVEYLVVPQIAGTHEAFHLLLDVNNGWLLGGLGLEIGSLAAYALLTRSVLPEQGRPPFSVIARIDLSTLALSHCVPAGSAAGLGLGYRLLTQFGVSRTGAVFAKAIQAVGSAVVLNVILWAALIASILLHGFSPVYGPVALVGVLLLTAAGTVVVVVTRGERRTARAVVAVAGRLPRVDPEAVSRAVTELADKLRALATDRKLLTRSVAWATANWLLDAAALWSCVRAFGHTLGLPGLLVPYGIANVLAVLPITPAGLGIVEGFLIPALVGFHTPRGVAILGVLAWRMFNFLLPIPTGGAAYVTLVRRRSRARRAVGTVGT